MLIGVTKLFSRAECWQRGQAPSSEYTGRNVWLGALVWGSLRDWPLITHNYPDPGGTVPLPSHRWTFFSSGRGLAHARGTEWLCHRNRGSSLLSLSLRGVLFSDPNALLGTHAVERDEGLSLGYGSVVECLRAENLGSTPDTNQQRSLRTEAGSVPVTQT